MHPTPQKLRWVPELVVRAIHHDTITRDGGLPGLVDDGLLESALARPRNLAEYSEDADIAALSACYAYGIASSHPFNDGNKRVAFVVMAVFAQMNGWVLAASEVDATTTMLALASGDLSEADLASWLRGELVPVVRSTLKG